LYGSEYRRIKQLDAGIRRSEKFQSVAKREKREKGNIKNIILWILIKMSDFVMYSEIHTAEQRVHGVDKRKIRRIKCE
jgi:hypothetical protein